VPALHPLEDMVNALKATNTLSVDSVEGVPYLYYMLAAMFYNSKDEGIPPSRLYKLIDEEKQLAQEGKIQWIGYNIVVSKL